MIEAICIKDYRMTDKSLAFLKGSIYKFDLTESYGCFVVGKNEQGSPEHYLPQTDFIKFFRTKNDAVKILFTKKTT